MEQQLKNIVEKYKEVVAQRKELEEQAKKLKAEIEEPLKNTILQYMADHDVQSIHYPSVGRVVRTVKSHYEIKDKEQFALTILRALVAAGQDGRPLSDGMIVQYRVSKDVFTSYCEHSNNNNTGVELVERAELAIRSS